MPIFGQVWLWSLLAFLLGALLCWVLVVLPIRKRIVALERRLATVRHETRQPTPAGSDRPLERPVEPVEPPLATPSSIVPGFGEPDPQDEIRAESLTRAYALPGIPDPNAAPEAPEERGALRLSPDQQAGPPAPAEATEYIGSHSHQGWFEDEAPAARAGHHLVDDEDDEDERGTIFTQRTMPIPVETIRKLDDAARAETPPAHAAPEPMPAMPTAPVARDNSLIDDLEDEPVEEQPVEQLPPPVFAGSDTVVVHKNGAPQPEPEPQPAPEPVAKDRPEERIALVANNKNTMRAPIIELNKPLELDRQQSALPKRIPSKPQHRAPFGVQTVSPAVSAPVVAAAASGTDTAGAERMRSLFEPVIPAEAVGGQQNAVLPPPHRLQHTESRTNAPGPFGPGSAMPLPGGASPSPEFTVKASVTALRYCTSESPQFTKTVAEVWFRTAADAERVGFRPVG